MTIAHAIQSTPDACVFGDNASLNALSAQAVATWLRSFPSDETALPASTADLLSAALRVVTTFNTLRASILSERLLEKLLPHMHTQPLTVARNGKVVWEGTFTQALLEWAYDNGPSGLELLCTHKTTLLPQSGTAYAAAKVWEFALNQPSFANKVERGEVDGFMCCLLVHAKNEKVMSHPLWQQWLAKAGKRKATVPRLLSDIGHSDASPYTKGQWVRGISPHLDPDVVQQVWDQALQAVLHQGHFQTWWQITSALGMGKKQAVEKSQHFYGAVLTNIAKPQLWLRDVLALNIAQYTPSVVRAEYVRQLCTERVPFNTHAWFVHQQNGVVPKSVSCAQAQEFFQEQKKAMSISGLTPLDHSLSVLTVVDNWLLSAHLAEQLPVGRPSAKRKV